jgi:hypothetical protein
VQHLSRNLRPGVESGTRRHGPAAGKDRRQMDKEDRPPEVRFVGLEAGTVTPKGGHPARAEGSGAPSGGAWAVVGR